MLKTIVITPPPVEPVTAEEVIARLKIEVDEDNESEIDDLITAAREWCEGFQNRSYITQTREMALDCWPCGDTIDLPRPPLQSVVSVTYTDNAGNTATWPGANYIADMYSFMPRLVRTRGVSWPSVCLPSANGIKVRYVVGYEPVTGEDEEIDYAANIPKKIKQAIILLVGQWLESPGCEPSDAVKALLWQERVVPV